ncbi:hypothetical protein [Pedobacter aquatilis]|uniref:hypothetical protein n=1 Tax=Pedobacter aquatilis TaxID=351343 RepID=UPI00292EDA71|nr:hypothetical protein [Pedobacter aquatilis]
MKKFPFTPTGFQELQQQLYQLNNQELQLHYNAINQDFIHWLDHNFILSPQQIAHLKTLGLASIQNLASQTAIAVRGRLKVSLIKPPVKPVTGYDSKYIKITDRVFELAGAGEDFEAEGHLVIEIGY